MKSRFSTMMKFVALFNSIQMGKKARNMKFSMFPKKFFQNNFILYNFKKIYEIQGI